MSCCLCCLWIKLGTVQVCHIFSKGVFIMNKIWIFCDEKLSHFENVMRLLLSPIFDDSRTCGSCCMWSKLEPVQICETVQIFFIYHEQNWIFWLQLPIRQLQVCITGWILVCAEDSHSAVCSELQHNWCQCCLQ